jgi:hypothetical protein
VLSVMLVAHGLGEVCAGLPCPRFWVLALLSGSPGVIHTAKLIFFLKMCVLKILFRRLHREKVEKKSKSGFQDFFGIWA